MEEIDVRIATGVNRRHEWSTPSTEPLKNKSETSVRGDDYGSMASSSWVNDARVWEFKNAPRPGEVSPSAQSVCSKSTRANMDNCECHLTLQKADGPSQHVARHKCPDTSHGTGAGTTGGHEAPNGQEQQEESGIWSPSSSRQTPQSVDLEELNPSLDCEKLLCKVEQLAMELKSTNEYWKSKLNGLNMDL